MQTLKRIYGARFTGLRSMAFIATLSMLIGFGAPVSAAAVSSAAQPGSTSLIDIVPETALAYAEANLDPDADQMVLLMDLVERAGVADVLETGDMTGDTDIPAGAEVALVVTSIPETSDVDVDAIGNDPLSATDSLDDGGFALIVSSDDQQDLFQSTLADVEQSGDNVTETEYGGITITSSVPAADDEFSDSQAVAMVNDLVVIGTIPEDIEALIDAANGNVPGLASNETFQELTGMLPESRVASGFINGPALLNELNAMSPEALGTLDDQSVQALDAWTVFSFSAEQQGFLLETRSMANSAPFSESPALRGTFVDSVPDDALFMLNGVNIDSSGVLSSIALILVSTLTGEDIFATPTDVMVATPDPAEVFAQAESLLGFNIQTDFIDQLVGQYGIFVSVESLLGDNDLPDIDVLVMSEVDDTVAVEDVLAKLSFIVGAALTDQQTIETTNVNGSTVYSVDMSDTDSPILLQYGVVDGELVISIGSGLDSYEQGPVSPLSADPNFLAVMENLPTDYTSVAYVNAPEAANLVMEATSSLGGSDIEDANEACGDYPTQADAQVAYDEDQFTNFELDMDFDGEACEDFFGTVEATPATEPENPVIGVLGLGIVSTQQDGINGTSTFLLIADE